MTQIDSAFNTSDADGDSLLSRVEFKQFVSKMNEIGAARGLKHRDTTDEFIDKAFPCFSGFNPASPDGVTCQEIMMVLALVNAY